jgi:putative ABC transport system permease protein
MLQDIRLALRLVRRNRFSTAIALLSIALTVGATAVVFAAVKSVLLEPLPYFHPERLVQFRSDDPRVEKQSAGDWMIVHDIHELRRRWRTLESIGFYHNALLDLPGDGKTLPEALYGVQIDANVFRVLGVSPMLGRNILPEEDLPQHSEVIVLSYGLWVRRFHADPSIVGRSIAFTGHSSVVIGVMPPGFNFPLRREAAHTPSPYVEFWSGPLSISPNPNAGIEAVARVRPGVSVAEARQEVAGVSRELARDFPAFNRDRVLSANPLPQRAIGKAATGLWLLMAAAALFMLIGCGNVANLLLARGVGRQREIAVRMAMGAGASRIVRQLLTESCLLALLGGAGAYLFAAAAWRILPALAPVSIPRLAAARADSTVLAFALAVAVLNGIAFGIAPALGAARRRSRWNPFSARGATAGRHEGVRAWLIGAEVAFSVLLVVVGGQVLASFVRLVSLDPGFNQDHIVASVVIPAPDRYRTPEARSLFYRKMLDAVRAIPGTQLAGTVDALPFSGENHGGTVSGGEPNGLKLVAEIDVAGGDYLQAMGIRLLEGRWFHPEEADTGGDAAIVSADIAQRIWPRESALGKRMCLYCTPENPPNWKRVIGVVASAAHTALDEPQAGSVYLAAAAMQKAQFLVVRTPRPFGETQQAIRRAIAAIDPNQPVLLSASMQQLMADSVADRRFIMLLLAITAALALALAAAGIYGVISYSTSRRTAEIGIRMAVGAAPGDILALIFRQGFFVVAIGLAVGLGTAFEAIRVLRGVLPGLDSPQPGPIGAAAMLVAVTAAVACWVPARRATQTDPLAALRQE